MKDEYDAEMRRTTINFARKMHLLLSRSSLGFFAGYSCKLSVWTLGGFKIQFIMSEDDILYKYLLKRLPDVSIVEIGGFEVINPEAKRGRK